jgi:RecA-family ATPase
VDEEYKAKLLAGLKTGTWLDQQVFPPVTWHVPGLIPEGLSLLVGGPKVGKSWLMADVALAVAYGGITLGGIVVDQRPVLHLAFEDGDRRIQERTRFLLGTATPIPADWHYMTRLAGPDLVVPTIEAWLENLPPGSPPPLVILDTLGKVMPPSVPGESAYQRDYRIAGRLKAITDVNPGMSLVVIHHDRKASSDDFVDSVSGTNGLAGAADTIIVLTRPRNESQGLLKITGRDVEEAEYAVRFDNRAWELVGGDLAEAAANARTLRATANLGDRQTQILDYVNSNPGGVTPANVAALFDMTSNDAAQYLTRLLKKERVCRPKRGLYTPVVPVVSVVSDE